MNGEAAGTREDRQGGRETSCPKKSHGPTAGGRKEGQLDRRTDGIEAEVHSEFLREAALSQKATGLDLKGRKFPVPLVPRSVLLR